MWGELVTGPSGAPFVFCPAELALELFRGALPPLEPERGGGAELGLGCQV